MVVAKRRGTLAANMLFVVAVVLAIFGFHGVFGITVSPDLGMRNITSSQLIETVLMNKTSEIDESVADRNRRLIPYMTFYMPNDYDVNQHYNYIPEQQKQMIAFYQSQQPQQINIDQNPPQQKQPQSNRFQVRFPSNKPKYQAIVYGTRHQLSIPGKENAHHQGIPISYKESKLARPAHPYSSTTKVTPFAPSNKLPGHFTPIIYVHPTDNINYSRKPQGNHQYNEILNEQQNYQQDIRNELQIPVSIYTTPKTPIFVSPSPRPLYVNDNGQRPHQQLQPPMQFQQESSVNLTPQQKYVEYLKEQLRYKQRQYYQQQEPAYVVNASPPPPVANNILSYDKPEQMPINQIAYQPDIGPSGGESVGGSYQQPPPPQLIPYNQAPPAQPYDYNQSPSPRPPTYNNYPKYVEVIVQEPQQMMTAPPEKPIGFKQTVYVTTAAPIMVPSVSPIYKMEQSHRPIEIPKPTQSPRPFEIQPVEPSRSVYGPQIKYKLEKRPQFIHSPTPTPQIYRQHLTETTQVPPPILTTYHPDFISSKPIYRPNFSTVRPYKPKITQKYKPISVAKPIAQAITRPQPTPVPIENNNHYGNITHNSLADILHKLQESNELPKTFTPDNIDNSIRTLIRILNNLKQSQTIVEDPPQRHEDDYDDYDDAPLVDPSHPSPNSGRPGIDYPAYSEIPQTRFNCKEQRYKGFFGDPETHCQVWHYCDLNGGQASFLCPNGTIFSQVALTCDWWFNVKCSSTAQLYVLNERLYKYILPLTPKFPEDYSGPLVDKYLALKFKEMEEKMRREKTKGKSKSEEDDEADDDDEEEDGEEGGSQESEEIVPSTTTQSGEISENQSHGSDEERSRAAVIVTTTPVIPSLQSMPIVVTSTEEPELYSPSPPSVKTSVESEKVEVIEIKTDGTSGHLIPSRIFNSGLKK